MLRSRAGAALNDTCGTTAVNTGTGMLQDAVLRDAMPTDFFDVKEDVTPKAPPKAMLGMAALAYVPTFVVFVILLVNEANYTFSETKITKKDISDGEWECVMISKVGGGAATAMVMMMTMMMTMVSRVLGSAPPVGQPPPPR